MSLRKRQLNRARRKPYTCEIKPSRSIILYSETYHMYFPVKIIENYSVNPDGSETK